MSIFRLSTSLSVRGEAVIEQVRDLSNFEKNTMHRVSRVPEDILELAAALVEDEATVENSNFLM